MQANQLLGNLCERNTKALFKGFLILLEDLHKDHELNFDKLRIAMPEQYQALLDQADYFDYDKMQYLRKKTLDLGNEIMRNIESEFQNFTIEFKFDNENR